MHHRPRANPLAHVRKYNYLSSDPVPSLKSVTATLRKGHGQVSMHGDDSLLEAQSCLPDGKLLTTWRTSLFSSKTEQRSLIQYNEKKLCGTGMVSSSVALLI